MKTPMPIEVKTNILRNNHITEERLKTAEKKHKELIARAQLFEEKLGRLNGIIKSFESQESEIFVNQVGSYPRLM